MGHETVRKEPVSTAEARGEAARAGAAAESFPEDVAKIIEAMVATVNRASSGSVAKSPPAKQGHMGSERTSPGEGNDPPIS